MVRYFITLLKRLKYNLKHLFSREKTIPETSIFFKNIGNDHTIDNFLSHYFMENVGSHDFGPKVFGIEILYPLGWRDVPLLTSDGLRFSEDIFSSYNFSSKKLKPAYFNIADVKVPYELARLQFIQKRVLPQESDIEIEVNDFPKIFWNSPMDVAIRNINLILYQKWGYKYCGLHIINEGEKLSNEYISKHYEYIISNLENTGNVVGNHYLIELTSILFTIANFDFEDKREHFALYHDELSKQLDAQFYPDGTNFEGSTHYSALVIEALIICKLSIESIDQNSNLLPRIEKIIKSNRLFLSLLMNNNELSQIGDNDSGRLFYKNFDEDNPLNMKWLLNLIDYTYQDSLDDKEINEKYKNEINYEIPNFDEYKKVLHKPIEVFTKDYEAYSFIEFGMFIWRNQEEYFSIRCGPIGQNGVGGHSHYDQLAIECFTKRNWIARDPGTGTYTDDIKLRNKFRSMEYHWGPKAKIKFPNEDEFSCFKLNYMSDGEVLRFDKNNFLGYAEFNGKRIYRKIRIEDGIVYIEDYSNDVELEEYKAWGEENAGIKVQFSEGYKRII